MTAAITITNLSKSYRLYEKPIDRLKQIFTRKPYGRCVEALKRVNLTVERGETVALIGRNGSGKSTLLQLVAGTLTPSTGNIEVNGRISALLELGAGFDPELTGHENLYLNASVLGLKPTEIKACYHDILEFAAIGEAIKQPIKTYSSGMVVRLAFAIAVAVQPDILVVDEALAVGDEAFQRKCFARIRAMQKKGCTILLVSHAAQTVVELASRAVLMDKGEKLLEGNPKQVMACYHQLIYAKDEAQAAIRQNLQEQEKIHAAKTPEENQTIAYPSHGVVIGKPQLIDEKGKVVELLERGKPYSLRYRVFFQAEARTVRMGMMIKTISGLNIGGKLTHPPQSGKGFNPKAGDMIDIYSRFVCTLLPETYFITVGCWGKPVGQEEETVLHKLLDAVMFKVLPDGALSESGIVDLGIETKVEPHTHDA